MTHVSCGRTNRSARAEAITRVLREQQGFCLDVGCGRTFDLDNDIQHMGVYRCLECARWLCKPCIVAHFEATTDAYQPARSARAIEPAQTSAAAQEVTDTTTTETGKAEGRGARLSVAGASRALPCGHPTRTSPGVASRTADNR